MKGNYYVDLHNHTIIPSLELADEYQAWAKRWPLRYTTYTCGWIVYATDQDLAWFIVKWPQQ